MRGRPRKPLEKAADVGPLAAYVKGKKLRCGSCSKTPSPAVKWVMKVIDGKECPVGMGCQKCYDGWFNCLRGRHKTWKEFCKKKAVDVKLQNIFDEVCDMQVQLPADPRPFPVGEVLVESACSLESQVSGRLIRTQNFGNRVGISGLKPKDANIKEEKIHVHGQNRKVSGVLLLDELEEDADIPVVVKSTTTINKLEYHLRASNHLHQNQLQEVFEEERKKHSKGIPKSLRGFAKHVWTLESLQNHCATHALLAAGADEDQGESAEEGGDDEDKQKENDGGALAIEDGTAHSAGCPWDGPARPSTPVARGLSASSLHGSARPPEGCR